jgi:hypothetical protein
MSEKHFVIGGFLLVFACMCSMVMGVIWGASEIVGRIDTEIKIISILDDYALDESQIMASEKGVTFKNLIIGEIAVTKTGLGSGVRRDFEVITDGESIFFTAACVRNTAGEDTCYIE